MASITVFRKLAPFVWTNPFSAATYSTVTVDVSPWLPLITSKQISLLGLVVLALKYGHKSEPSVSSYVSFRRVKKKNDFSVSIMTPHNGEDLSFITLKKMNETSNSDILKDLSQQLQALNSLGHSEQFQPAYSLLRYVPTLLLYLIFPIIKHLIHRVRLPWLPYKPFGDIIVSNVGSLGFDSALLPLTPLARASAMVAVGKLKNGQVQLGFTMDHRLMDGFHAKKFMDGFLPVFQDPEKYLNAGN